jgi:hypothetical protein
VSASGSGGVAVIPIDRGDQGGSSGGGCKLWVAILTEIWVFKKRTEKLSTNDFLKK